VGIYTERILPRVIDVVLDTGEVRRLRRRALEGLSGEVLEVGFGSGLNVPFYPPGVTRVLAVDPAVTARRLAARRLAGSPVEIVFVGTDAADLPLPDESVDNALSTFTLCTIPRVAEALAEIRRVLRPGGRLWFLEHGLSPDPGVATRQHRLTPLQRRIAGGCHLDRPVRQLVEDARLAVERLSTGYMRGPKPYTFIYEGIARKEDRR